MVRVSRLEAHVTTLMEKTFLSTPSPLVPLVLLSILEQYVIAL